MELTAARTGIAWPRWERHDNVSGRRNDAIKTTERALNLALQTNNQELAASLRATLERYTNAAVEISRR